MGACVGYLSSNVKRTLRPKNWRSVRKEYLKVPLDKISVNYDITDTEWLMTAMEDESKELLDNVNVNVKAKAKVNNHKTKDKQTGKVKAGKNTSSVNSKSSSSFFSTDMKDAFESGSGSDYETEMNPQTKGKDSKQKSMTNRPTEEVPLFWMSSDDEDEVDTKDELLFNGSGSSKSKSEYRESESIGDSRKNHSQNCQGKTERTFDKEETFSVCLSDNAKKLEECCERGDAKTGQLIN